jgi:hypothetical protein
MRKILSFTFVGLFFFCSWTTQQEKEIKKAEWLIGTWENRTPRGNIYETWTKTGEDEFTEKSYALKGNDTFFFETVRLVQEQKEVVYIATVKNQNEGQAVRFAGRMISDKQLIFENQQHDYPQVISYRKITSDSLVAEISGTKNGQQSRQTFSMKRVN